MVCCGRRGRTLRHCYQLPPGLAAPCSPSWVNGALPARRQVGDGSPGTNRRECSDAMGRDRPVADPVHCPPSRPTSGTPCPCIALVAVDFVPDVPHPAPAALGFQRATSLMTFVSGHPESQITGLAAFRFSGSTPHCSSPAYWPWVHVSAEAQQRSGMQQRATLFGLDLNKLIRGGKPPRPTRSTTQMGEDTAIMSPVSTQQLCMVRS